MDHIEFIKSINYNNNLERNIKEFFDQIVALYSVIDNRFQNLDISTDTEVESIPSIRFIMLTDTEEDAKALFSSLCDRIICIYGHKYVARLSQIDKSLNVELIEEVSG